MTWWRNTDGNAVDDSFPFGWNGVALRFEMNGKQVGKVILIGTGLFVLGCVWIVSRWAAVPSGTFDSTVKRMTSEGSRIKVIAENTGPNEPLSFLLRIRFPVSKLGTKIGFPDASTVYLLQDEAGVCLCTAHRRRGDVCFVTLENDSASLASVEAFATDLRNAFPNLRTKVLKP